MRGEDDVRVVEQGVVLGRFRIEHVEPHAGESAGFQRVESGAENVG